MTRQSLIKALVAQIEAHTFQFLYRNVSKPEYRGRGWAGALTIYSPNGPQPDTEGHFRWLETIIAERDGAHTASAKRAIANAVLNWGGMKTAISDTPSGIAVLDAVISSARTGNVVNNAPMNSSYTKVAAVFGFGCKHHNTIWDSRVSTALCFRLAKLFEEQGDPRKTLPELFPGLGYVTGRSQRVLGRMELVKEFWPNVYQKWSGHYAGANVAHEIAVALNNQNIECPKFGADPQAGKWTAWKVNMVLFMDDLTSAPDRAAQRGKKPAKAVPTVNRNPEAEEFCGHRIVNRQDGIHFEPVSIRGPLNTATGMSAGKHGLNDRRLLLEFYRMANGNCKISCRVRTTDPSFDSLREAALEANCPQKRGGILLDSPTECIFVYPLGPVGSDQDEAVIRRFVNTPAESYAEFLSVLPEIMA